MKKILITGANSYIGTSFENHLKQWSEQYQVDTVDMVDGSWREKSFAGYDSVFHVAGIAHIKEKKANQDLYFKVNRDLPTEVAVKAKSEGVKQFIFMSTMSVYGKETGVITKETPIMPKTYYGKSKYEAETKISALMDDNYFVCILRPPMVYGDGCKGNYQTLLKVIKMLPIFPNINNKRSMVAIERLCGYVEGLIKYGKSGLFFPQDSEYMTTKHLSQIIAHSLNKKIYYSKLFGLAVLICRPFSKTISKAFGNLIYEEME